MARWIFGLSLVAIAAALVVTAVAYIRGERYAEETARLQALMSVSERAQAERILDASVDRTELITTLTALQIRNQALIEADTHLRLDTGAGQAALVQEGKVLREMALVAGSEEPLTTPDGRRWLFPLPRGELKVGQLVKGGSFDVPEWWYLSQGIPAPALDERRQAGVYGAYAVVLSDGTVVHSLPITPPTGSTLPPDQPWRGALALPEADLEALFATLAPGMSVYVY